MRASAGMALSQYLARGMVLVRGVLAASALGPQGYGGWNALNLILDYGYFAPAGALQGLDLKLPAPVERGDTEQSRRLMAGAWAATLLGAVLFSVLVLAWPRFAGRAAASIFGPGTVPLMLAAAVLQLAMLYLSSALRAHGRFGAVSRGQSVQAVVGGGLGIALLWRWGVWGLIGGWIAGTLAGVVLMARAVPEAPLAPALPGQGLALARAGLPIFAFYALSLLLRSTDRLAFVHYGATAALGQYSLGLMAAGLVLYLPEAVGFVLFPRVAAAADGARDPERTRADLVRAHRVLSVVMPLPVALAMVWAGPVVGRLLPAYRDGVESLRLLALGALGFSVATLPGYFLLASGLHRRLLVVGSVATAANAAMVFGVASRDPRPGSVALAALAGYSLFALGLVGTAASALFTGSLERVRFALSSFAPALWTGVVATAACRWGASETPLVALVRSAAVILLVVPVLAWFTRGTGLRSFLRDQSVASTP